MTIYKKLSSVLVTFILIGCASNKLNDNAAAVVVAPDSQNVPAGCKELGLVSGSQGNILTINFTSGSTLSNGAMNELKNNAALMGANYVQVLTSQTDPNLHGGFLSVNNFGTAYKCSESSIDK